MLRDQRLKGDATSATGRSSIPLQLVATQATFDWYTAPEQSLEKGDKGIILIYVSPKAYFKVPGIWYNEECDDQLCKSNVWIYIPLNHTV